MNCVGVADDFLDTLGDQTKKMSRLEITYSSISSRSGALDLTIHHFKKQSARRGTLFHRCIRKIFGINRISGKITGRRL